MLNKLIYRDTNRLCDRYLEWVQPLLKNDAEKLLTSKAVADFRARRAPALQEMLQKRMESNEPLLENIPYWDDWYLAERSPLPINSNPFYLLDLPLRQQGEQAAELVSAACIFFRLVETNTLEPDTLHGEPLCMEQYSNMFCAVRSPRRHRDVFVKNKASRHIVVFCRGNIYRLDVFDEKGRLSRKEPIQEALEKILATATHSQFSPGTLTSMDRDRWAEARSKLADSHPENAVALETIESAVFSLSLDNFSPGTQEAAARTLLHGDTGNRWFDKSIQFIVCANGVAGLNFEHSHLDGSPMARLVRFVTGKEPETSIVTGNFSPCTRELPLHIPTELRKTITEADKTTRRFDSNTLMRCLEFEPFGKEEIKRRGISPDAFIQIALQLAQHRTWGKIFSVFESVMLRSFLRGRTEAMRPLSVESSAFVASMADPGASDGTRGTLLRLAVEQHVKRIRQCMAGEGVEGHLHALLLLWKETGEAIPPALYIDEGWKRLVYTVFTTSTTRVDGLALGGYGPAVSDGFAFRFLKKPDFLRFFVCCRSDLTDDLERFTGHLFASLEDTLKLLH